jgi:hypothetical protein
MNDLVCPACLGREPQRNKDCPRCHGIKPERKVATVELTEAEAIGLIWWARCGEVSIRGYGLPSPEGTNMLHSSDALKKVVRALAVEQGSGGNFDQGEYEGMGDRPGSFTTRVFPASEA